MYKPNQRLWCCIGVAARKVVPCEYVAPYVCNACIARGYAVRVIAGTVTTVDSDQLFESEAQAYKALYHYYSVKSIESMLRIEKLEDEITGYEEWKRRCNGVTYV